MSYFVRKIDGFTARIPPEHRRSFYGYIEAWTSIVINTLLFFVKFFLGIAINSISLIADSFHTVSDVVTSLVVLFGFHLAKKAPDKEHPYGHGRIESVASVIIALLLILTGLEFMKDSYLRLLAPPRVEASWMILAVLAVSAWLKEWLARFSLQLGNKIDSEALVADAWHHRSDALATLLVIIGVGANFYNLKWVDPLAGIGVSLFIIYAGAVMIRDAGSTLVGKSPSENLLRLITAHAQEIEGVEGIHDISVHEYGEKKAISLHIEVEGAMSVNDAHAIANAVEEKINQSFNCITTVHVDPPRKKEMN